jgi:hypothetical protein
MGKPIAQIFLSYAHLDNAKLHGFEMGWVDRFYNALEHELPTHGVEVRWWRDKRDLEPETYFDESILNAVAHSDAFLAILSPAYPQRPFCLKELNHFLDDPKGSAVNQRCRRVLKVIKRPMTDPDISRILPGQISGSGEFRFYTVDRQTDRVLVFIHPNGEIARPEFWDALEELAAAIARVVHQMKPRPQMSGSDLTTYVAEPAEDQDQSYRTIRSELMANGFRVLPERRIPDDYREALTFIDDQLSRCILSVHLLGERSGYIPSGESAKPITSLQLDRAEARCNTDPSFRRFIWTKQNLKPVQDDQKALIDGFQKGSTLLPTDEFVTEPLELFKDVVLEHLRGRVVLSTRTKPKHPYPILLIAHPADESLVRDLNASLYKAKYEPFYINRETIELRDEKIIARLAAQVEAAIVLYSTADETWAQTVLAKLHKISMEREDGRPAVRAVLFRSGSENVAYRFRSHYCNLLLASTSDSSWDSALGELHARISLVTRP